MSQSFITPGHVRVFQAIRSQLYDNITLTSVYVNGEPGVAIVMVDEVGEGKAAVMPLFVALTSKMRLVFPGETEGGDGEGGPECPDTKEDAKSEVTRHWRDGPR